MWVTPWRCSEVCGAGAGMVGLCLEDVSNFTDSVIPSHACLVGKGHQQNWCLESICFQQWSFPLVYLCLE